MTQRSAFQIGHSYVATESFLKALIVDDHALFREGFALLLRALVPEIELSQATSVAEALPQLDCSASEVVFLDWWLQDASGADALDALRRVAPTSRVVILSGERDPEVVHLAIGKGACGFIPKESNMTELTEALQVIFKGCIYLPPNKLAPASSVERSQQARTLAECFPELTARQIDVFRSALRGHGNKQIARELLISPATVATHLIAVYGAIGVRNRTEAVFTAAKRGALIS